MKYFYKQRNNQSTDNWQRRNGTYHPFCHGKPIHCWLLPLYSKAAFNIFLTNNGRNRGCYIAPYLYWMGLQPFKGRTKNGQACRRVLFYLSGWQNKNTYVRTPKQRYDNITDVFPDIHNRVPQHMIASYLGITPIHLSRLKKAAIENYKHLLSFRLYCPNYFCIIIKQNCNDKKIFNSILMVFYLTIFLVTQSIAQKSVMTKSMTRLPIW